MAACLPSRKWKLRGQPPVQSIVVDPFCGGGTIVAAAKKLGRRWLATEMDNATALVARKRVGEMQALGGR